MKSRVAYMAWTAAVLLSSPAHGQQLPLRGYGQLEGLSNLTVQTVVQDQTGYLWAGTENGVYRFDGSRFRRVGGQRQAGTASVSALHVDAAGRLWAGTESGLFLVEGDRLRPVLRKDGELLQVQLGQHFSSVSADELLVQSNGRLFRIQPDHKGGWSGTPFFSAAQLDARHELNDLRGILRDADGTIWMGCGVSLCRYGDGKLTVMGSAQGLPEQHLQGLLREADGTLWVAGSGQLLMLAPGARTFVDRSPEHYSVPDFNLGVPLLKDRDGRLLIVSENGLFRFDADGWQRFGPAQGLRIPLGAHSLLVDHDGDLWLGLPGRGLIQWLGYPHWENWTRQEGVPDDDTWSIFRTQAGALYAGTGNGLAHLEGRRFVSAAAGQQWSAMAEDRRGGLWAASFAGTLLRLDGKGVVHEVAHLPDRRIVYKLLFDAAGRLWIGTDRGLYVIADPRRSATPERVAAALDLQGMDAGYTSACTDAGGRLWFVGGKGLLRLQDGRWTQIPLPAGAHVYTQMACDGNTLWLAENHPARLWSADATAAMPQLRSTGHEVLEGRAIQSLLVDRRHWAWLGTDAGLMVWNGKHWRLFNQQSGMVWNDTNQGAIFEDSDGSIWAGTSNGLTHVLRPEALFEPSRIPLQMSSVRYDGAPLHEVTAPWGGGALEVRLAAPLYRNHEMLSFRYRLLGQEDAWSTSDNGELRYAALAPGGYRLQVMATHSSLQASSPVLELPLTIAPPWWRTYWAYACYALLTLIVIGLAHRYRVARVLRQQALLERRVAERTAELEASREEHRLRSLKDGLTGAWNRGALMERLERMMEPGGAPFLLVLLDLDYFKRINDTHGHLAGDEVLRVVVRRVQAQLRASDTIGRYGGEEFMLLLPGLDQAGGAPRLRQLHEAISAQPVRIDATLELRINCSCGVVAGQPGREFTAEQWIGLADQALYRAKALGRARIEYSAQ